MRVVRALFWLLCLGILKVQAATDCTQVTEIPQIECEALVAFYESTGGEYWMVSRRWNVTNAPCSWFGIKCNNGYVSSVNLSGNRLSGLIPPELNKLGYLQYLNLSENWLGSLIPPELGKLSNLQELNLSSNQLSGSIPPELGNLSNLQKLNLYKNLLSGSIPPELGNLSNLLYLELSVNQLGGSIPSELGNLNSLQGLYLDGNQLSGSIPSELGNLSNLQRFYSGSNQLDGSIPSELGNLSNLQELYLSVNQLYGSIPLELGNLNNLQGLYLGGNRLSGLIPPQLGNLSNLQWLNLSYNGLCGDIPTQLFDLDKLEFLYLEYNALSIIDSSFITSFNSLKEVILDQLAYPYAPDYHYHYYHYYPYYYFSCSTTETTTIEKPGQPPCEVTAQIPPELDFQIVALNTPTTLNTQLTWTTTTDCLLTPKIELDGPTDFTLTQTHCTPDNRYSNCQTNVTFTPTTEGQQQATLNLTLENSLAATLPIQGQGVDADPEFTITPLAYDFGPHKAGHDSSDPQIFTLENTGQIIVQIDHITLTNTTDFSLQNWHCTYQPRLAPQATCTVSVQFTPQIDSPFGPTQTHLIIETNAQETVEIPLTGTIEKTANCTSDYITLASTTSGAWQDPNTWNQTRVPDERDVILIQANHEIAAPAFAKIRALCLENNATLTSADFQGTPLEIQATDYLENYGQIIGRRGADENERGTCTQPNSIDTPLCAQSGASVILKVGEDFNSVDKMGDFWWYGSGGPIVNAGIIQAGDGGHGKQYGAPGGNAIVLGRNTLNKNIIQAGNGGDILTPQAGQSGRGGLTQIWGKLGGAGYLKSPAGSQVISGHAGRCHPNPTGEQTSGQGGNLWLVSLPDVYVDASVQAGQSDPYCTMPGVDGWIQIEPATINLFGADITGGQVDIYGGDEFVLDFSNINRPLVKATGDITLAVGKDGVIDLRGNSTPLFETTGKVNIFTDHLLLDDTVQVADLFAVNDPDQDIRQGTAKTLSSVSLNAIGKVTGQPGEAVPVILTLANNSPITDVFTLKGVEDLLLQTVEITGLTMVELPFMMTIPEQPTRLEIMAISQNDPDVFAILSIPVTIATTTSATVITPAPIKVTMPSFLVPLVPACPQIPLIDFVCSNQGQMLYDTTLTASASVSGGEYAGMIENRGLISQAVILPEAVISGGFLSGYVVNEGTLEDVTFVGAELTGGFLAGVVKNKSQVSGVIQDVTLLPGARIQGGRVKGLIQGDPDQPALLVDVLVLPGTQLRHVVLGAGTILHADTQLETGVTFEE